MSKNERITLWQSTEETWTKLANTVLSQKQLIVNTDLSGIDASTCTYCRTHHCILLFRA